MSLTQSVSCYDRYPESSLMTLNSCLVNSGEEGYHVYSAFVKKGILVTQCCVLQGFVYLLSGLDRFHVYSVIDIERYPGYTVLHSVVYSVPGLPRYFAFSGFSYTGVLIYIFSCEAGLEAGLLRPSVRP